MLVAATGMLAGCAEVAGTDAYRGYAPIPNDILALMGEKGSSKTAPRADPLPQAGSRARGVEAAGRRSLRPAETYPMCRWSGQLGPKVREGDSQVPEGFYTVTPASMNPNSAYDLSFDAGYPNAYDRALGRTGTAIMVHRICSSAGCFSMTNTQIEKIYAIVREAFAGGQRGIQMQSLQLRMTPANIAQHRLDPNAAFWRELKHDADHFEVKSRETPAGVGGRRYVFATAIAGDRLDPVAACPPMREDQRSNARSPPGTDATRPRSSRPRRRT